MMYSPLSITDSATETIGVVVAAAAVLAAAAAAAVLAVVGHDHLDY